MNQRPLALSSIPFTLIAAACGGMGALPPTPTAVSAGNVAPAVVPDRDPATIDALRARGRAGLDELLATYDHTPDGAARAALATTIDLVAAQRYATVSRLFWHTELAAAMAEARDTGKPILSLRMLGRLDQDLSCANSRFFRTILYPDPAISKVLRDQFVLYWSSERAVPRVTIDYGDGRTIERTVTGNSVHYVLDATGAPIDALPGLYAPSVFHVELDRALALHRELAGATGARRARQLSAHHAARAAAVADQWAGLGGSITLDVGTARILRGADAANALARAQRATMSKAMIEVPEIAQIDLSPDPRAMLPDVDQWATIGQALYGLGESTAKAAGPAPRRWRGAARSAPAPGILSQPARSLIAQVMAGAMAGDQRLPAAAVDTAIARLERTVIADTAINELQLRPQIRAVLASSAPSFDDLNRFVYATVFATPSDDQWLGLLRRDVYSGIPGDGVVISR